MAAKMRRAQPALYYFPLTLTLSPIGGEGINKAVRVRPYLCRDIFENDNRSRSEIA
jgi:hypothetical protein